MRLLSIFKPTHNLLFMCSVCVCLLCLLSILLTCWTYIRPICVCNCGSEINRLCFSQPEAMPPTSRNITRPSSTPGGGGAKSILQWNIKVLLVCEPGSMRKINGVLSYRIQFRYWRDKNSRCKSLSIFGLELKMFLQMVLNHPSYFPIP